MILIIVMVVLGIIALTRDKLVILRNRAVMGQDSKNIGIILIVGAIGGLLIGWVHILALIVAIVYGLMKAKEI